jgi:hypothetical protein
MEYTDGVPSPETYRQWAAVSCLAGALERRCWTRVTNSFLYPNLMVLLVGGPGVGKSMAINEAADMWTATGEFNVAPHSLTKAAFIDQLKLRARTLKIDQDTILYHSLLIPSREFGVLVTAHDLAFLNTLNDIYDCGKLFEERTRSGGVLSIDYPHMSLLGGTQPKYLSSILPEEAWGMGFTSRIIMVYSSKRVTISLFNKITKSDSMRAKLLSDLKEISRLAGEFRWDADAAAAVDEWHMSGCNPVPAHPRLQNYVPRRTMHCMKIAMALSVSRNSDLIITLADFLEAKELLTSAEYTMPEIFKEMTSEPDAEILAEAYTWCVMQFNRTKKPVREHTLTYFIMQKTSVQKVSFMLDTMIKAGMLDVDGVNTSPNRLFIPRGRNELGMPH